MFTETMPDLLHVLFMNRSRYYAHHTIPSALNYETLSILLMASEGKENNNAQRPHISKYFYCLTGMSPHSSLHTFT